MANQALVVSTLVDCADWADYPDGILAVAASTMDYAASCQCDRPLVDIVF